MESTEQAARRIFAERASFYTSSAAHIDQQVLAEVVRLAAPQPAWRALDVATGSGHTAFALAPLVGAIVAADLTPEMLAEALGLREQKGLTNVLFATCDVHYLPFAAATFDLLTCRRAAHHFSNLTLALSEMRRVLKPGARLVIDDRSVPAAAAIDQAMNQIDKLHDESHVRQYPPAEWRAVLEASGFAISELNPYTRHRPLTSFTDDVSAANVAAIHRLLQALPPDQREAMGVREVNGELYITHWYLTLAATRV